MFSFDFSDQIQFSKAVFHHFKQIPLPRKFKDATGGMGTHAPEKGYIELYDTEGCCAHLSVGPSFCDNILPLILTGEQKSYNQWRHDLYWKVRNSGFQSGVAVDLGMLDLMMLDILAQRSEQPLHRFMGASKDWAAAYKGGGSILLEDEELVSDMVRYVDEGYTTVKFKVGHDDMCKDLCRLEKVRTALGDTIKIAVDANQKWDAGNALEFLRLAQPYNLAWLEEPIHSHDMNGIRCIKDSAIEQGITTPLAFGESMRIFFAYETYVEKGVTHLQPSVGRMTRMDDLIRISDLSRDCNIQFSSGGRVYLNAIFGCLYNEDEYIEYHEPISKPVGEYTLNKPEERDGRFYCPTHIWGNPIRINLEKIEADGLLLGCQIFYPNN